MIVNKNYPLKNITTIGLGGHCREYVCPSDQDDLKNVMKKMAKIVDDQNEKDLAYARSGRSNYTKMSDDFENSIAFSAACDLVFKGRVQPSGYTEPLLHQKRLERKSIN